MLSVSAELLAVQPEGNPQQQESVSLNRANVSDSDLCQLGSHNTTVCVCGDAPLLNIRLQGPSRGHTGAARGRAAPCGGRDDKMLSGALQEV